MKITLTADRLRELLSYDRETGRFVWLKQQNNRMRVGQTAGSDNGKGYLQIRIDGVKYRSHRLAWMYMTGEWPAFEVDHVNGIKHDNRFDNLRKSDRSLNLQNQYKALKNNRTGLLGVSKRGDDTYIARIRINGALKHLGTHKTAEAAHMAYVSAKREMHPGGML